MRTVVPWSAPGSGQTSFLAALGPAVGQLPGWTIVGRDTVTRRFLTRQGRRLTSEWRFPARPRRDVPLRFHLDDSDADASCSADVEIVDQHVRPTEERPDLAEHDLHLYLHDPARDAEQQKANLEVVDLMIDTLRSRPPGRRRPHLAVCVVRFDDPAVLAEARRRQLICPVDERFVVGSPSPCRPREFLRAFADEDLVDTIDGYFDDRATVFASSAVGLRRAGDGRIDTHDCANLKQVGGEITLLSPARPFNIVQPLHWLLTRG